MPEISAEIVQKYARLGLKTSEIAALLESTAEDLRARFSPQLTLGNAEYKRDLRAWQYALAQSKNGPMLIWLGKNELAQTDRPVQPGLPEPEVDPEMG
jgi:hypothetical protein